MGILSDGTVNLVALIDDTNVRDNRNMTFDQELHLWEVIGTWAAAIATFLAVLVSLYLARSDAKTALKGFVGVRTIIDPLINVSSEEVFVSLTNVRLRPVTLSNIGWEVGLFYKKQYYTQIPGFNSPQLPQVINYGDTLNLIISSGNADTWIKEFSEKLEDFHLSKLKYLKFCVYTSIGKTIRFKPEASFLKRLSDNYSKHSKNNT